MILTTYGYVTDTREVAGKKNPDRKFTNCNIRVNPYDYNYLTSGVRLPQGKSLPTSKLYKLILDINQTWVEKDCKTHITLVDYFEDDRDSHSAGFNNAENKNKEGK